MHTNIPNTITKFIADYIKNKSKVAQQILPKKTPWKTAQPIVSLYLCQYKKSVTDPVLYCIYFKELCDTLTDYLPTYT